MLRMRPPSYHTRRVCRITPNHKQLRCLMTQAVAAARRCSGCQRRAVSDAGCAVRGCARRRLRRRGSTPAEARRISLATHTPSTPLFLARRRASAATCTASNRGVIRGLLQLRRQRQTRTGLGPDRSCCEVLLDRNWTWCQAAGKRRRRHPCYCRRWCRRRSPLPARCTGTGYWARRPANASSSDSDSGVTRWWPRPQAQWLCHSGAVAHAVAASGGAAAVPRNRVHSGTRRPAERCWLDTARGRRRLWECV